MIVASREARYSTFCDNTLMCFILVICTPHGIGQPTNLWPDTLTLPIGFLNVTLGACNRKQYLSINVQKASYPNASERAVTDTKWNVMTVGMQRAYPSDKRHHESEQCTVNMD